VSGIALIRGFVVAKFLVGVVLFGAAYVWYRQVGLPWFVGLLGLMILATCVAFALLIRGWELDKLLEPALYLLAAIAAWRRRMGWVLALAALATLNRETGVFAALIAMSVDRRWWFWGCVPACLAIALPLRVLGPQPTESIVEALQSNVSPERLVYVVGGLCLVPLLALAFVRYVTPPLQSLYVLLAPAMVAAALVSDRLEQGALLLAPVALLFVPVTLLGLRDVAALRAGRVAPG
jgi:hypothetical protein